MYDLINKKRQQMGRVEGSKNSQIYQRIVLKKLPICGREVSKIQKNCQICLWMVPKLYQQIIFQNDCKQMKN